jgi:hypothetical protein
MGAPVNGGFHGTTRIVRDDPGLNSWAAHLLPSMENVCVTSGVPVRTAVSN